jgi:D-serine deaminase-like pyridoxal phosphate-dependent protein
MSAAPSPFRLLRERARRRRRVLTLAAVAAGAALVRPSNRGAPHPPRFAALQAELQASGPGKPVVLLDLDALDANIDAVRRAVAPGLAVRVVAKSLPSIPLLRHVLARLGTDRLMVFDESIELLAAELPAADLLLGKPLPVQAARAFYAAQSKVGIASPGARIQWLIDGPERLAQYAALARSLGVKMRVNIEIDVGLHRGGVPDPASLRPVLEAISADPRHLELAGLMGYDAHVPSAPPLLSSRERALRDVIARYRAFQEVVRAHAPDPAYRQLVFNGAGSKTYSLYRERDPLNEVALGSAFVMPASFDGPTLTSHATALFIATPVLKRLAGTRIPFLEWASRPWTLWDPNRQVTYFVFAGGWLAQPVSPPGLVENPLYGFSTNQAILNGSEKTSLAPDDWIFFRPTQSERVLQEFGSIRTVRDGRLADIWPAMPFLP